MAIITSLLLSALISLSTASPVSSVLPYSIPQPGFSQPLRAAGIATKRLTFLYGPAVAGGPYFPNGTLGQQYVNKAAGIVAAELAAQDVLVYNNSAAANANSKQYNGLMTLDDYTKLYDGLWQSASAPTGQVPGMLTNYTQDLLFSMERLSISPFAVSRLDPATNASLPFTVSDTIVQNITGQTLNALFTSGRLFYVNYQAQGALPKTAQYAPASDAYFYISPSSGQFLPLAIRPNAGSTLTYTPADTATDWLLAKIMYNVNDFFFAQIHHLANTHYVLDIVYEAAVRTLSDDHPVQGILSRIMYSELGVRPFAADFLFQPGGSIDQIFGASGAGASTYATDLYNSGYAGAFQSNYFYTNLQRRGLLNATSGPALTHFPFFEDAQPIYEATRSFVTALINSYYSNDAAVLSDSELQAWATEANGPAKIIDFPQAFQTRDQIIDAVTHMAHLSSSAHHPVNTNELLTAGGVLPFQPPALWQPVPTSKGVSNIVPFLPPLNSSITYLMFSGNTARPLIAGTSRTLVNMFNDVSMLLRMNGATQQANQQFIKAMLARSQVVKSRTFDANGLSQGMPFVWQGLNPNVVPWSTTI